MFSFSTFCFLLIIIVQRCGLLAMNTLHNFIQKLQNSHLLGKHIKGIKSNEAIIEFIKRNL